MSPIPQNASRRIRVVTLVDYLTLAGGAERLALQIATRLDAEQFESILCVSRFPTRPGRETTAAEVQALKLLEQTDVRFLALERRRKVELKAWARLGRFLRRERVDVLHTHKFGSNVWGTLAGRIAHVPVIVAHEHTWSYQGQPLRRLIDRELVARCADRFIAVSREDQRRMIEVERIDPGRTVFIPNGVEPLPRPSGRSVRSELGIESGAPVLGVVGILEDVHKAAKMPFASPGRTIVLLRAGDAGDITDAESEFGSSEYAKEILGALWGYPPELDLEKEAALQKVVVELISQGLVDSVHDCADGGLAVALAEKAFAKGVGARVNLASNGLPAEYVLFGEDASRIGISCDPVSVARIQQVAEENGIYADVIGETIADRLEISLDGQAIVSAAVSELSRAYDSALESSLRTDPELVSAH